MEAGRKRVGVIGGGQLAWMMGPAAQSLGVELVVQTPSLTDPAVAIAMDTVLADIEDAQATARLAQQCEVITFENEFIDLEGLTVLAQQGVQFQPALSTLQPLLDKYDQRCLLQALNLPTPRFLALEHPELPAGWQFPVVVKARRHGYDGQGTFILKTQADLEQVWQRLGQPSVLLEEWVPFERELAVMSARSHTGEIVTYPVAETQQVEQVCRRVLVPAAVDQSVQQQVVQIAHRLLDQLKAVGIFGIELFLTAEGKVLVNEIAPRTHNSGHYTLDACATSQFEQHLRAVCHLPLGSIAWTQTATEHCCGAVMVNLLGYEDSDSDYAEQRQQLASLPHSFVYWYGKTPARPGRKLGHVTVLLMQPTATLQNWAEQLRTDSQRLIQQVESIWYGESSLLLP